MVAKHEKEPGASSTAPDAEPPAEKVVPVENDAASSDVPYSIYTTNQKRLMVLAGSLAAFFSPLSANIYMPALNTLAKDLHVSNTLIGFTVTSYLIFQGLAPTFVGAFADAQGRRPAYIGCIIIYLCANIGLALQRNYAALLILRCLQSSGSSGTVALSNAVTADLVTSAERGAYIGYASVAAILAPSLAPVLGGLLAQYAGWPWIFWFLVIFAVAFFVPFFVWFPETCRRIVGNGSIPPPRLNHSLPTWLAERRLKAAGQHEAFAERDALAAKRRLQFPSPVDTLKIICTRLAGTVLVTNGLLFSCYYAVNASLPSQFEAAYGLNDVQISLIYLPLGVGSLLSAFTIGKLIDWNYRRHAARLGFPVQRNRQADLSGFPIERARLEIALPLLAFGAASIVVYGWLLEARVSIAGPCVMLFGLGYAVVAGFNTMAVLMIDVYPGAPATATAANNLVRCWMGAGATAFVIPLTEKIGVGWTCTLFSGVWVVFSFPMLIMLMRRGPRWREETRDREERRRKAKEGVGSGEKEAGAREEVVGKEMKV
ncbi:citrate synthase [Trichodelitschia bisporula]|uniref:Citrate synthase n=1 Tax=Trichodelitschia bisporula TaxID=703511 RepID=A0A6G1HLB1_9PEZI|nr:citrate synthase [Trichodelitschia bisporula]